MSEKCSNEDVWGTILLTGVILLFVNGFMQCQDRDQMETRLSNQIERVERNLEWRIQRLERSR